MEALYMMEAMENDPNLAFLAGIVILAMAGGLILWGLVETINHFFFKKEDKVESPAIEDTKEEVTNIGLLTMVGKLIIQSFNYIIYHRVLFKEKNQKESPILAYKNEVRTFSTGLLTQQKAWKNLQKIKKLHKKRIDLFISARAAKDTEELIRLSGKLEQIEYSMQEAWNFPRDKSKHTWWYQIPNCTCPKLDNNDPDYKKLYNGGRIISADCPVHSNIQYINEKKYAMH